MSDPITSQVLQPTNPTFSKDANTPKDKGQTRILQDGSLLYLEPITNTEVPAVRLSDIRPGLVSEASRQRSYRFPKKRGYDDTNVTASVKKDYNYGPKRENRPERLFQIKNDRAKGEKPDGYVMDRGRIVLDAFDHGLRNFGHQLPLYVSSELEGQDIEDYLRRNREISVYDLIARAPNGYYKGRPEGESKRTKRDDQAREWHEGPPRVGTFSMRATRFRLGAGCLSWERKDGTAAKNQRILDVIPARFKDPAVNSTRGWRDLSKEEMKRIEKGAMSKPQLGRKTKGTAKAEKEKGGKGRAIADSVEGGGVPGDGEEVQFGDADGWMGASNEQGSDVWPDYNPADFEISPPAPQLCPQNSPSKHSRHSANEVDGKTVSGKSRSFQQDPPPPRKRARSALAADSDERSDDRAQKRVKVTSTAQADSNTGSASRILTSRVPRKQQKQAAHSNTGTVSPITTSRVPRKQQKQAAREPSATGGGLPASTRPDSNVLCQSFRPALSNSGFDSSPPVLNGGHAQQYNSSYTTNAETVMPGWYDSSWQSGSDDSFFQPPLAQNGNCGTLQSTSFLVDQQPSFSSSSPYLDNAITPDLSVQDNDPGYYAPVSDFQPSGSLGYDSAWCDPRQMSSFERGPNQCNAPFTQPSEWGYSQNLPPSPEVPGKRKRVQSSVAEQREGPRPIKRTKRHTANPAVVPEVPYPNDSVIGAYHPTLPGGYAGYETPPPGYKPFAMHATGFPQPGTSFPNASPNLLPSFDGESWTGEVFPNEGQGHMPPITDLDGMPDLHAPGPVDTDPSHQAPDFAPTYQDVHDGSAQNSYTQQLTGFQSTQWQPMQPAQSDEWDSSWLALASRWDT